MKCGHVRAEGAAGGAACVRETALTCATSRVFRETNGLEADAELFLKPILPQMNQRLEILLRIEQLHTGISLEKPLHSSMWGDHAPAVLSQELFKS